MTQYAHNSIIWSVAPDGRTWAVAPEPFEKYVMRCQCASCSAFKKQGEKCSRCERNQEKANDLVN